jgi:cholest-4-en-3-one 26-monooxygenase
MQRSMSQASDPGNQDYAYDLTDPAFFAAGDPYAIWRRLRAEDPVHLTRGRIRTPFWSLTRHEDALTVFRNPIIFSSQRVSPLLPVDTFAEEHEHEREDGKGAILVMTDPPFHTTLRKSYNASFLPRAVAKLEESARQIAREIIDEVAPKGACDLVTDVAGRFPLAIICQMMNIPRSDWSSLLKWSHMAIASDEPEWQIGTSEETRREGFLRISTYCLKAALERRGKPVTDLLAAMGNAEVNGRKWNEREIAFNGVLTVLGGIDTTRNTTAGAMLEMIRNRAEMERLRANPALMRTAVEEALRWTSPIAHVRRLATRDFEMRERKISEGDWVVVWIASANRDEEVFANPDQFDVGRSPNEHLAFLYGEHYCLGAHLARLELRVILSELINRLPDIELNGAVEWTQSTQVPGIKHMPVKFTPRAAQR